MTSLVLGHTPAASDTGGRNAVAFDVYKPSSGLERNVVKETQLLQPDNNERKTNFKHFHDHSSVTTVNPVCTVYKKKTTFHFGNSTWD